MIGQSGRVRPRVARAANTNGSQYEQQRPAASSTIPLTLRLRMSYLRLMIISSLVLGAFNKS